MQIREEITELPRFKTGSVLILDESADEKASEKTAGAGRQYNGRMGKVEMRQVGTFLAYAQSGLWAWIDGELFLPEFWLTDAMAKERRRLGIPPERRFATKIELGWQMIERVVGEGLPFEWVCFDTCLRAQSLAATQGGWRQPDLSGRCACRHASLLEQACGWCAGAQSR